MNRWLLLYSLLLYILSPLLHGDRVQYRIENERALWKIDTLKAGFRIAATGERNGAEWGMPGFALARDNQGEIELWAGNLQRKGLLRELSDPFSLSVHSSGFYEVSGYKADFSLEPVSTRGGAFRLPVAFMGSVLSLGITGQDEYSRVYVSSMRKVPSGSIDTFLLFCSNERRSSDGLISDYGIRPHTKPLCFSGFRLTAVEGGCRFGALFSMVQSSAGQPGALLRFHLRLGTHQSGGFACLLLGRTVTDTYTDAYGCRIPEESELQIRGEYARDNYQIFAEGTLERNRETAVPQLYIDTLRTIQGGWRVETDWLRFRYTGECSLRTQDPSGSTVEEEHELTIRYGQSWWWSEISGEAGRELGGDYLFQAEGEAGIRLAPLKIRLGLDSTSSISLRIDYKSRADPVISAFLTIGVSVHKGGDPPFSCDTVHLGWEYSDS